VDGDGSITIDELRRALPNMKDSTDAIDRRTTKVR